MRLLAAAVGLLLAAGGGAEEDEDLFSGGAACVPHACASGETAVPKPTLKLTSGGCENFGGMQMFSGMGGRGGAGDGALGRCCDLRHACYGVCGSEKKYCDDQFSRCVSFKCGKIGNPTAREKCESDGKLKVMMSGLGGCKKFDESQRAACRCVADRKVLAKRVKVLEAFYGKHNPAKAGASEELKALAKKAASTPKFAKLLNKLVRKYPKSIKKVRDPQQAMFEDMMAKYNVGDESDHGGSGGGGGGSAQRKKRGGGGGRARRRARAEEAEAEAEAESDEEEDVVELGDEHDEI